MSTTIRCEMISPTYIYTPPSIPETRGAVVGADVVLKHPPTYADTRNPLLSSLVLVPSPRHYDLRYTPLPSLTLVIVIDYVHHRGRGGAIAQERVRERACGHVLP